MHLILGAEPEHISPRGGKQQANRQQILRPLPGAAALSPRRDRAFLRLAQEEQRRGRVETVRRGRQSGTPGPSGGLSQVPGYATSSGRHI